MQHIEETKSEQGDHENTQGQQEQEEVAVIATTDAVVHPGTMMVKCLDAVVADTAVGAPWRSIELAGGTPLHAYCDTLDLYVLVQRGTEIIILYFVFMGSWVNTRIHESR